MKVVALGPKLAKKKVKAYITTNPVWLSGAVQWSYGIARPSMKATIIRNPASWILNRPTTSMRATVNQYPGTVPHSAISVCARDVEQLVQRAHRPRHRDPPDRAEDVLLEQVLRVVGDVQEEPRRRRAHQVGAVPPRELPRQEPERPAALGAPGRHLGLLLGDLHPEHPGHVRRGALRVPGHQRRVPRRLRHLHPPVEGERRGHRAQHEDDEPHQVRLRRGGRRGVHGVRGRREPAPEDGGDADRDRAAGQDAEPLHHEHGGDEGAPGPLVGVLGHDGGGQRVVAADAEAEPEAEEAERGHDARRRVAEREPRRDGADDHQQQRDAVDALPADLVAEPPEEELPGQRADEGHAVDGRGDVRRQGAGVGRAVDGVVDAADELGDEGDAEEVVGVGEEAHTGDDDGREVVPLRLGAVQRREHVHVALPARHCPIGRGSRSSGAVPRQL
ncbi:hypothetical protein PVAP13_9NG766900 [Panicum virgatum]|uniref:Uncharacterized protein n=1 Tax=Panicum virgatum TaxID=38727 RepID=A0A8T0N3M2_PANVG|nr:hypothetical protein PVAP13_9NG766900 [Panicum virgatum]